MKRKVFLVIALIMPVWIILSLLVPQLLTRYDPSATDTMIRLQAPSAAHWFGTDDLGRDVFTRVIYGTRNTVAASTIALLIGVGFGLLIGVTAGVAGRHVDGLLMRVVDMILSIPGFLLSVTIVTAIGFGTIPVAIAIGVSLIPEFARTVRARVLTLRQLGYVEAAQVAGADTWSIVFSHILPNALGPVASMTVIDIGNSIMYVAALSFLGFGPKPPAPEWGSIINAGRSFLIGAPWISILPGCIIVLSIVSLNYLGGRLGRRVSL